MPATELSPPRPALDRARPGTTITAEFHWRKTPAAGALILRFMQSRFIAQTFAIAIIVIGPDIASAENYPVKPVRMVT